MRDDTTRRGLLAAVLGGGAGAAALSPAAPLLERFAPPSGRIWSDTRQEVPETVSSRHGDATVTYDDHHVPHVEADDERAAYFAVGFVHAADRLFEMDLIRRRMDAHLAGAVGTRGLESDVFSAKMDFRAAAEASRRALAGTRAEAMAKAYADGVNVFRDIGPTPLEFGLLGYEAHEWAPVDSLLVGMQISWGLTGSFRPLRREVLRDRLGPRDYRRLYDRPHDHGYPIIRDAIGGTVEGRGGQPGGPDGPGSDAPRRLGGPGSRSSPAGGGAPARRRVDPRFAAWLTSHEPPPTRGSNHWAVSGEHTETGSPMLAYDPHLTLMAPPVWYEQRVTVDDYDVRGATFPGLPFVIVGENQHGAWGFTNTGADVVDHYTYETDGDEYRAPDGWRSFDAGRRHVPVAGGEDRGVEVRKTVHGPFVDRELDGTRRHVGVAWTGTSGTRESQAIYEMNRARDHEEFREALREMDVPTQNALWVDDEHVYYKVSGRIPVRRVDGRVVRGDRVFDGSAGEAEWEGFEPFGQSSWDGFVPFADKPGVLDPDYVGTANQRVLDDPTYPIGQEYASGFRGSRIYERLDRRIGGEQPVDVAFMRSLQRDTLDRRARALVPAVLDARDRMADEVDPWLDELDEWDYRMDRDSAAALAFGVFYEEFRRSTWGDAFEDADLDEAWWPSGWRLVSLPADDPYFDGDRAAVIAGAMEDAVSRIDREGWETYGDVNRTTIDHPFGGEVPALNYPRYPTDGTGYTVFNVHDGAGAGSSWRQVSPIGAESLSVLPGGQDGSYFSAHYDDQVRAWADGEYKPMAFETPPEGETIEFRGEES